MRSLRPIVAALAAAAALAVTSLARADRVAVLPLAGAGQTKAELDDARARVREAVSDLRHTLPTDAELAAAEGTVRDGVPDTRDEYMTAGRASNAAWTVGGRVESRGHYRRIEIEVCQIATGRVESLARNMAPSEERKKTGEMLALLLRGEGIANAVIPWQDEVPGLPAEPEPPPPEPKPAPEPEPAAEPPPPPAPYAHERPLAIGVSAGVLSAVSRPENAAGNATTATLAANLGYAIESVPGLELRADVGGGLVSPRSFFIAAGARYAFVVAPGAGLYLGPEAKVGGFFPIAGDKKARALLQGSPFVGMALAKSIAIELFGDVAFAPGGTGALLLVGGGARALVRF